MHTRSSQSSPNSQNLEPEEDVGIKVPIILRPPVQGVESKSLMAVVYRSPMRHIKDLEVLMNTTLLGLREKIVEESEKRRLQCSLVHGKTDLFYAFYQ
jgi:hypothetical protein